MEKTEEKRSSISMTQPLQLIGQNGEPSSGSYSAPTSKTMNQTPKEATEFLAGIKLFLVMFSITMAAFLMLLDASIVATAIPKITSQFHSLDDEGWYGTAYLMTTCALQPLTGKIYTCYNIKWMFLAFFGLFELGSALCGAATSSNMLIVGRAISGLGAAGIVNGSYTIIATVLPLAKQPSYRGILMGLAFFGLLGGPLIGGALTQHASWRWCFLINLPCGAAVAIFLILITIPDYRVHKQTAMQRLRRLDLIGFGLFTPTIIMFVLALQWGGTKYAWDSATIIGLLCGAGGNLIVFLAWERHVGDDAMIPLALVRRRAIWSSCLNTAGFIGCAFTTVYYFPIWFQAVKGASPTASGVDMVPLIALEMATTVITGALIQKVGYYLPFVLVGSALTSVGTGLVTTLTPSSTIGRRIGYQILQGCQGLAFQIPLLAVQTNVSKEQLAVATALVVFSQNLSGAVFLSLAEVIFSNQLRHELAIHAPSANVAAVISSGASASGVRNAVSASDLPGVIVAYSKSFDHVMYLAMGSAIGAFLFATCMGWVRVKEEEEEEVSLDGEMVETGRDSA